MKFSRISASIYYSVLTFLYYSYDSEFVYKVISRTGLASDSSPTRYQHDRLFSDRKGSHERNEEEEEEMVHGTLEVLLVGAKGLENTDYLCNMDPYAILKCRSQEQRSSIASGKGSNPEWNESFVFTVSDRATELLIKLLDSDTGTADDYVGEAAIPLEAVYTEGSIPPTAYNVVKGEHYCGEIKVGLTFTPEDVRQRGLPEDFGGWKQSH